MIKIKHPSAIGGPLKVGDSGCLLILQPEEIYYLPLNAAEGTTYKFLSTSGSQLRDPEDREIVVGNQKIVEVIFLQDRWIYSRTSITAFGAD